MRRRNFKIQVSARTERLVITSGGGCLSRAASLTPRAPALATRRRLAGSGERGGGNGGGRVLSALLECAQSTEGPGVQRHLLPTSGKPTPAITSRITAFVLNNCIRGRTISHSSYVSVWAGHQSKHPCSKSSLAGKKKKNLN